MKISALAVVLILATAPLLGAEKTYDLKFATVGGPQQPEVKALDVFSKEVERLSSGRINVRVYHSGQLGNQQSQLIGIMRGTMDMTFTDPNSLAQFEKKVGVLGAAYLFRDTAHMDKVMSGPTGRDFFETLAKGNGVRPLGAWYLGTRQLNLRNKAVKRPEDMRDVKLRMPNSPLWIAMGRALGANATPLGFSEIYLALKTGVIDAQDNPLPTDKAQKFYEVTKYIVLTNHQIGMIWPSINERLWQGMPEQYRGWIKEALETARVYQNKLVIDEEAALRKEFEGYGMVVVRPDIDAFKKNAAKVYSEFDGEWGKGMYERIQSIK